MNRMECLKPVSQAPAAPATQDSQLDLPTLWQAYQVSRDESLRNRLLVHFLPLSRMIARHMHARMPAAVEFDDLAQAAILGMRSAIATFDPTRGIPFENYCGPRVRGAVLDHLRSLDWAPRMLRSRFSRVQEMDRQLEMSSGRAPTDEQLSDALKMPLDELRTIRGEMVPPPVRIRVTQHDDEESTVNLDLLADRGNEDPLKEAQKADLREFLTRGLSTNERRLIILYYYENMSLREIGEVLGLCESRVSQIHQVVIKRLRERMHRIGGASIDD